MHSFRKLLQNPPQCAPGFKNRPRSKYRTYPPPELQDTTELAIICKSGAACKKNEGGQDLDFCELLGPFIFWGQTQGKQNLALFCEGPKPRILAFPMAGN